MNYKAIIFDLDGTLLDSMDAWYNADKAFVESCGFSYPEGLSDKMKTLGYKDACQIFLDEFPIKMTLNDVMEKIKLLIEKEYKEKMKLKPFVKDFLIKQKADNVNMCIATACRADLAESALKRLEIYDFFSFIVTDEQVNKGKDDPYIFNYCKQKLNCKETDILVIEDALHCVKTAKEAGFNVIGAYDRSNEPQIEEIKKYCDKYIYSFEELL